MLKLRKAIRLESLGLPFKQALPIAAQLGAEGLEINARTEIRPGDLSRTGVRHIKKMLDDYQLKVSCVNFQSRHGYSTLQNLDQRIDATKAAMTMAYNLGCAVVSNRIGRVPPDETSEQTTLVQALEDLGRHGSHVGALFAARTGDNEGDELAQFGKHLGPGALHIDFDPAELILQRMDVSTAMDSLADRVIHFRARDAVRDLSRSESVEVQLGRGSIDLPSLLAKLEEHHYHGFINIQRPTSPAARQEIFESLQYLENIFD